MKYHNACFGMRISVLIKKILILISLMLPQIIVSQNTFYRSIDIGTSENCKQIELFGNGYGLTAGEFCDSGARCLDWIIVDSVGEISFQKIYENGDFDFGSTNQGSYFTNGTQHYLTGNISSPQTANDIFVMQFDPYTGDSLWLKTYGEELHDLSTRLIEVEGQKMLLYGSRVLQQDQINRPIVTTWLLKLDTLGNIIWERDIGIEDALNVKMNSCLMGSDNYLSIYGSCEPWMEYCDLFEGYGLYATKTDTSGTEVWTKLLRRGARTHWSISDPVLLDDGLVVLNFINDTFPMNADSIALQDMLIWINEEGDIQREFTFKMDRFRNVYSLTKAANGDIIGAGSIDVSDRDLGQAGWVFRLNSQGGLLWERFIADVRFPLNLHRFNDVIESNDGGIVLTGSLQDSFPNHDPFINNPNIWLVKLDSMGCLEPDCGSFQVMGAVVGTETPIQLSPKATLHLFPNPTDDYFQLRWLEENQAAYPLNVSIYNLQGLLVFKQSYTKKPVIISSINWAKGMYLVKVKNKIGLTLTQKLIVQ